MARFASIFTLLFTFMLGAFGAISEARANPKFSFVRRSISLHALNSPRQELPALNRFESKTPKNRSPLPAKKSTIKTVRSAPLASAPFDLDRQVRSALLLDQATLIAQICPDPGLTGGVFRALQPRTIYGLLQKSTFASPELARVQRAAEPETSLPSEDDLLQPKSNALVSPRPTLEDLDRVGMERLGMDPASLEGLRVASPAENGSYTDLSQSFDSPLGQPKEAASSLKLDSYTTCLARLSTVWRVPAQVMGLFPFAMGPIEPMTQHFILMSTVKHIRAAIARAYFQTRALKILEEETGLTSFQVNRWLVGYGFNRLFSERNFMGATAASDVDFNILYNDQEIRDSTIHGKLRNAVFRMKKEMGELYSLELEVADFTVQPLTSVLHSVEAGDENTLNFYATVLGHDVHLFGSKKLQRRLFKAVSHAIEGQADLRIFKHYVGRETSKLSLGALLHIQELRQEAKEQGRDSRSGKVVARYHEPTLGMPLLGLAPTQAEKLIESPKLGQVLFPSKEIIRLWDFRQHDQQTQDLYQVVSRLQDLKIRRIDRKLSREFLVGLSQSEPNPLDLEARIRGFQRSASEKIDRKYTAIRVHNFADFARASGTRDGLKETIEYACQKNLVQSICPEIGNVFILSLQTLTEESDAALNKIGYAFLNELVETSMAAARRLAPIEYGQL